MSKGILVAERLTSFTKQALATVERESQGICRKAAADGMLDSGNRLTAQLEMVKSSFAVAIEKMSKTAVEALSPNAAAAAVRLEADNLSIGVAKEFELMLGGKGSGILAPGKSAALLREQLASFIGQMLIDTDNDIKAGVLKGQSGQNGYVAYLRKNSIAIIALIFSALSLYFTWSKAP